MLSDVYENNYSPKEQESRDLHITQQVNMNKGELRHNKTILDVDEALHSTLIFCEHDSDRDVIPDNTLKQPRTQNTQCCEDKNKTF